MVTIAMQANKRANEEFSHQNSWPLRLKVQFFTTEVTQKAKLRRANCKYLATFTAQ